MAQRSAAGQLGTWHFAFSSLQLQVPHSGSRARPLVRLSFLGGSILTVVKALADLWRSNSAHAGTHWHIVAVGCGWAVRLGGRSFVHRAVVSRGGVSVSLLQREVHAFGASNSLSCANGQAFALDLRTRSDLVPPLVHAWHGDRAGSDCTWLSGVILYRFTPLLTSLKPLKTRGVIGRPLRAEGQSQNGVFSIVISHCDAACVWFGSQVSFLEVGHEIAVTELTLPYCAWDFWLAVGVTSIGPCMHYLKNPATPYQPCMHMWLCPMSVPVAV